MDSAIGFPNIHPLYSDLSQIYLMDNAIQLLSNWGLVDNTIQCLNN